ncbi:MAG: 2-phospho-L-lactate transferase [Actinobacteria bacterium]|nr:2-phospho-L-lactate transferase [Actinomycetota bacterium]
MRVTMLSGGVGGAKLARGFAAMPGHELTVIANVGDDDRIYGLAVSPDIDTIIYTMAGREGPQGWGLAEDPFFAMDALDTLPIDASFRIGDGDLATNLFRTDRLLAGWSLTWVTTALASSFGIAATILPVTDDPLRTEVRVPGEGWISFQEYFVRRHHTDEVGDVRFRGSGFCRPAAGVIEALAGADVIVVGPSNPVLSIWPILAVPGVADTIDAHDRVIGVSPLIGGTALKGPADRVLVSMGHSADTAGVISSYSGLLTDLVVDDSDAPAMSSKRPRIHTAATRMDDLAASTKLAARVLEIAGE